MLNPDLDVVTSFRALKEADGLSEEKRSRCLACDQLYHQRRELVL